MKAATNIARPVAAAPVLVAPSADIKLLAMSPTSVQEAARALFVKAADAVRPDGEMAGDALFNTLLNEKMLAATRQGFALLIRSTGVATDDERLHPPSWFVLDESAVAMHYDRERQIRDLRRAAWEEERRSRAQDRQNAHAHAQEQKRLAYEAELSLAYRRMPVASRGILEALARVQGIDSMKPSEYLAAVAMQIALEKPIPEQHTPMPAHFRAPLSIPPFVPAPLATEGDD